MPSFSVAFNTKNVADSVIDFVDQIYTPEFMT
jgi:hypothetical protein